MLLVWGAVLALASLAASQDLRIGESESNPCINIDNCKDCIRTAPNCAWCSQETFDRASSRCDLFKRLVEHNCPSGAIIFPQSDTKVSQNDNVRGGDGVLQPIQVQPQAMNITARTHEPISFKLIFRQAENYPVDLYFLLDLSYTMVEEEEAQRRLINLGQEMPQSMSNITRDFALGFGTFVDKTVLPYTAWTKRLLEDRCPLADKTCKPPHDFINQLKLSKNAEQFKNKMTDALKAVSQSFDDSEGGLDGMMQALACEDIIGWRARSRRIIVYSSNSMFHVAGDGKLGGATKNNDGLCHLNSATGEYEEEKTFDFPSVSQIAAKLQDRSTSVIFAVMPSVLFHYESLRFLIGGEIGVLEDKSANIVSLIRNNYEKLRSKIQFLPRKSDHITFSFKSKCKGEVLQETSECDGLEITESVMFDVTMTVGSEACIGQTGIVERTVDLMAQGLAEKLSINLKIICDCECNAPPAAEASTKCTNGNGMVECGICSCNPGRYGRECECDESQISSEESLKKCRKGNETEVCTNHGECICGVCDCFTLGPNTARRYSGPFCECNDYSCARSKDNSLCGGADKGTCKCGKCECLQGWKGDACDCSTDNSTCQTPNGECNGKGECMCGRCKCFANSDYIGPTCEDCPNCPSKCSQYRDCAQCKGFGTGKYTRDECNKECDAVEMVDTLEAGSASVRTCDFRDTDNCLFHFTYEYDADNNVIIKVQKTKECPEEVNLAIIIGPVVAAVVLIPLLLICLFILIRNRRDRAEFARFMKEKDKAKWESGANPIYKDPKSTFQNPTYKSGK